MKPKETKSLNISFRLWSSLVSAKAESGKMLGDLMEECWFNSQAQGALVPNPGAPRTPPSDNQTVHGNGAEAIRDLREALHQMALAVELAENAIRTGSTDGDGAIHGAEAERGKGEDSGALKKAKAHPIRRARG